MRCEAMKILALLLCLSFLACAGSIPQQEAANLCMEAEKLFNEGNEKSATSHEETVALWRKASARLERAIKEGGLANGAVFYNLGNVYFRLGDMGRAILNYRRAQRFTPNDSNLMRNLEYARRNCQDSVQEQESTKVLKTLFFWHYDFALSTREMVFLIAFVAFCSLGILRIRLARSWLAITIAGVGFMALVMAGSIAMTELGENRRSRGVILDKEVVARTGNSSAYEESFEKPLHAGTEFIVLENRGQWLEIQLADGKTCWIPGESADTVIIR